MRNVLGMAILCGLMATAAAAQKCEWVTLNLSSEGALGGSCSVRAEKMTNCQAILIRECVHGSGRRPLAASEADRLFELAEASKLFDGDYAGVDHSAVDIPFTKLTYRNERIAILVVSGNPSFQKPGPRSELVQMLWTLGKTIEVK